MNTIVLTSRKREFLVAREVGRRSRRPTRRWWSDHDRAGDGLAFGHWDDQVLDDFDEIERARLNELVNEPTAYLVEWKGGALVERMLRSVPPGTCAAVDNDHGLLVPVHQVAGEPLESWVKASSLP